jgi:hypothetical protein
MKEEHGKEQRKRTCVKRDTVCSPAARPWLECGVMDEVMLTHRVRCYYSFRKE